MIILFKKYSDLLLMLILLMISLYIIYKVLNIDVSGWALGELLINYEGGFVRRGLVGHLVFMTSNPLYTINLIQNLVIILFLTGSIFILSIENSLKSKILYFIILVFAPGTLLDIASGSDIASGVMVYLDRKEIWFYCSLILIIIISNKIGYYNIRTVVLTSILSTLMIFNHETYAFFVAPSLLFIYFLNKEKILLNTSVFIIPSSIAFLSVFYFHGDASTAKAIENSYFVSHGITNIGGGISAIGWEFSQSFDLSKKMYTDGSILYWFFNCLLAGCFILLYQIVKFRDGKSLRASAIISFLLISAVLIAIISGWDWGRWISIYSILSILIFNLLSISLKSINEFNYFMILNDIKITGHCNKLNCTIAAFILFLVFLGINTKLHTCCPQKPVIELKTPGL